MAAAQLNDWARIAGPVRGTDIEELAPWPQALQLTATDESEIEERPSAGEWPRA